MFFLLFLLLLVSYLLVLSAKQQPWLIVPITSGYVTETQYVGFALSINFIPITGNWWSWWGSRGRPCMLLLKVPGERQSPSANCAISSFQNSCPTWITCSISHCLVFFFFPLCCYLLGLIFQLSFLISIIMFGLPLIVKYKVTLCLQWCKFLWWEACR